MRREMGYGWCVEGGWYSTRTRAYNRRRRSIVWERGKRPHRRGRRRGRRRRRDGTTRTSSRKGLRCFEMGRLTLPSFLWAGTPTRRRRTRATITPATRSTGSPCHGVLYSGHLTKNRRRRGERMDKRGSGGGRDGNGRGMTFIPFPMAVAILSLCPFFCLSVVGRLHDASLLIFGWLRFTSMQDNFLLF